MYVHNGYVHNGYVIDLWLILDAGLKMMNWNDLSQFDVRLVCVQLIDLQLLFFS